jgi:predicted Zn-dependent peptidase
MFKIKQDLPFNWINTDKFKDMIISIRFAVENVEPNVSMNNILSYMMSDRSEMYPSKQLMSNQMDALFGLSLSSKTTTFGAAHVIEIRIRTLNERYTDQPHIQEAARFLMDCVRRPLINEASLCEAKKNLIASLKRIQDKPSHLGIIRVCEGVGKDTPLAVFSQGNIDVIESIELDALKAYHQELLKQVQPMILIMGDFKGLDQKKLQKQLTFNQTLDILPSAYVFQPRHSFKATIQKETSQTTFTQLYATHTAYNDPDYLAMRLYVIMLGQLPNSLLFQEIREKRSLCYSISASSFNFDGVMAIQTGINHKDLDEVEMLIELQRIKLAKGKFSQALLKTAQKMFINGLESMIDEPYAYLNFMYQRGYTQHDLNLKATIKAIRNVSKNDIEAIAQKIELIGQYTIRGKN